MKKYNVITPLARFENIQPLVQMLLPKNVHWHVIIDADAQYDVNFELDWVTKYICPNSGSIFWERCNNSLNWFIDTVELKEDEMYCILNDDDAYEPDFFSKLDKIDSKVIVCSMLRGDQTPSSATGVRAHPTHKLLAVPQNMFVGGVGIEQIILSGDTLSRYRIPVNGCGDGMFISQIVHENKTEYASEANVWFNYYEPGRWNK